MEELKQWMGTLCFMDYLQAFVDKLGVECIEDLQLVTAEDLPLVGLKPIQARRFARVVFQDSILSGAPLLSPAPQPLCRLSTNEHVADPSRDDLSLPFVDGPDLRHNDDGARHCADGGLRVTGARRVYHTGDLDKDVNGHCREADTSPSSKRLKVGHLSAKQRTDRAAGESVGLARLHRPLSNSHGGVKGPSAATSYCGTGHAIRGGSDGCRCEQVFDSLAPQLPAAKRTARKMQQVTGEGGARNRQFLYNCARLGALVMNLLFDGRGDWLVHESCARRRLTVSNWWLARCHNRAIEVAQIPTVKINESFIASSSNVNSLVRRIRRPDGCLLWSLQYFKSSTLDAVFDGTTSTDHGLRGVPSNRPKVEERTMFGAFVRANRSPTGQTVEKYGRCHGAAFYLDSN